MHAGGFGRLLQALHHRPERFHREPLFEDEAAAQVDRTRAAHRQIVHRAVDRQRTDVAAGKEQRMHDVGIRGESQPRAAQFKDRAVVPRLRQRAVEGRQNHLLDQLVHQLAAAAMGQRHRGIVGDRQRAAQRKVLYGAHLLFLSCGRQLSAPIAVVRSARAFVRNHRCAQRLLRRALPSEGAALVRLLLPLHDQAADAQRALQCLAIYDSPRETLPA